jgi:hypothetical protein
LSWVELNLGWIGVEVWWSWWGALICIRGAGCLTTVYWMVCLESSSSWAICYLSKACWMNWGA